MKNNIAVIIYQNVVNAMQDAEEMGGPEGDEYIISGTKLFVTYAHVADWLLCIARTRQGKAAQGGITVFLVDAKASGISYSPMPVISGEKVCLSTGVPSADW